MRKLFASLLFGWVAQSRENGQINGCLNCSAVQTKPGLSALFSFSPVTAAAVICGTMYGFSQNLPDSSSADTTVQTTDSSKNQISLSDIGGSLYSTRYGKPTELPWIKIYLAGSVSNIGGSGQRITIHGSLLRIRHLGVRWEAPLKNDWFTSAGAAVGSHPSVYDSWHAEKHIWTRSELGKKLTDHHTLSAEAVPHIWEYRIPEISERIRFKELNTSLIWKSDFRDRPFAPKTGLFFSQSLTGNPISTYREPQTGKRHTQLGGTTDIRGYTSPGNGKITLAGQLKGELIYSGELNRFDRKYLGGNETVRGFSAGSYGSDRIYNNRASAAAEVRFPIFSIKGINLSFLSWYDKSMKKLPVDVTGAAFVNAGRLWHSIDGTFSSAEPHWSAAGAGTGIRVLFPSLSMSASGDLGWPIYSPDNKYGAVPILHGYLNFPF